MIGLVICSHGGVASCGASNWRSELSIASPCRHRRQRFPFQAENTHAQIQDDYYANIGNAYPGQGQAYPPKDAR
jgi:hypothetical protein